MSQNRDFTDYLRDMLDAALKAQRFTSGLDYDTFASDDKTVFAVVRALEIIGEACRNVPAPFRDRHPELPWRAMAGIRDRLIHRYYKVDAEVVWRTVREDLPLLKTSLEHILGENDD